MHNTYIAKLKYSMELYVYKGEWDLPSIDFDCLRILMFIKLSDAPVQIKISNKVFWSPNGIFPYLQIGVTRIAGYQKIIHFLNNEGYNLPITDDNRSEFDEGYVEFFRQNLYPYFMYTLWCPQNIEQTRALYAKRTQFPLNFYTPKKYAQKTESIIKHLYNFSLEDPIVKHNIGDMALKAKQCINMLESRLKGRDWISGVRPCVIDCQIYAYLAIILNHPFNSTLRIHAQQCPTLINYIQRITTIYFTNEGFNSNKENKEKKNMEDDKKCYKDESQLDEDPQKTRKRIIISAIVAIISMTSYALFKGILQLSYSGDSEFIDYEENEEDENVD